MILSLLRSPSSYRREPLEYRRNQEWRQWPHYDAEVFDAIEAMTEIPQDYTSDIYWPTGA